MKLTILEGNRLALDGGAMFGNAPKELWKRWISPDPLNRIYLASRALLIQVHGKNILLETGSGAFFEPKLRERYQIAHVNQILVSLNEIGLTDEDIDAVILSHLHFDHAGGLLTAYNEKAPLQLLFPNASYYVGREHWEYALHPHIRETSSFIPELFPLLNTSRRLNLIDPHATPFLEDGLTFLYSQGHTRGLMLTRIELSTGPLLFASDLIPGEAWLHLPITMGYDRFPELLIDEKTHLLTQLAQDQGSVLFCHDPNLALGKVSRHVHSGKFILTPLESIKC
ncbi:MAG: MBL fold hydrolase [Parachlamydia sp.]|nr:MAG: MBL fold hydrolase [Parachlamydia sp.]